MQPHESAGSSTRGRRCCGGTPPAGWRPVPACGSSPQRGSVDRRRACRRPRRADPGPGLPRASSAHGSLRFPRAWCRRKRRSRRPAPNAGKESGHEAPSTPPMPSNRPVTPTPQSAVKVCRNSGLANHDLGELLRIGAETGQPCRPVQTGVLFGQFLEAPPGCNSESASRRLTTSQCPAAIFFSSSNTRWAS